MILSPSVQEAIRTHAEEEYPLECCGILIGLPGPEARVTTARRAHNRNEEGARDRFDLDPRDYLQAEEEVADTPEEILGFYHSHPDHPAWPSPTDLIRAQPWGGYFHLIVAVHADGFRKDLRVWQVTEDEEGFVEETLQVEAVAKGNLHP